MRTSSTFISGAVAAVAVAGSAMASTAVINGGASWTGWTSVGQSNALGIWVNGPTTAPPAGGYSIYTTSFLFANQPVTGSPSGSPDLSGWAVGARILGVGIQGPHVVAGQGPIFKFDLGSDSYRPATSVGGTDGVGAFTVTGHVGDFNVQVNGDNNIAYQPNIINVLTSNGVYWGGTGAFAPVSNPTTYARSFFDVANGSMQVLFNLDLLSGSGGIGTIPAGTFNMVVAAAGASGVVTESFLVVPAPGAVALLGAAGLVGSRRRRS